MVRLTDCLNMTITVDLDVKPHVTNTSTLSNVLPRLLTCTLTCSLCPFYSSGSVVLSSMCLFLYGPGFVDMISLCVLSSLTIISLEKRGLVALLIPFLIVLDILCLFLLVPRVGL